MNEKFKAHFKLPWDGFLEAIDLRDVSVGFSVYKTGSVEGFKSLFRVFIKNEESNNPNSLKPIIVTASYGKESPDGIILSSDEFKRKSNGPIDYISEAEFFYDIDSDKIYHKKKEITGLELLKIAYKWHTKTTKPIGGSWLRFKLFWFHYIQAGFWKIIFHVIAAIQYLASGEKIKILYNFSDPESARYQILQIKQSELIDLWGYKVKPWIAGTYGFLHLFFYVIFYILNLRPPLLVILFKVDFLTFMYGIVSLGLANTILPMLLGPVNLKRALKKIQQTYWSYAIRSVKI